MLAHLRHLNPVANLKDRPRLCLGQLIYILIFLGLLGVVIWYITKEVKNYKESLRKPYTALTLKEQKEIDFPVITVCAFFRDDEPFNVTYKSLDQYNVKVGIPSLRKFHAGGYLCWALNENLKSAKGTNFRFRLGDFRISNAINGFTFYMDNYPQKRSSAELEVLADTSVQVIPTGALSYFSLRKIFTTDLMGETRIYFNYTINVFVSYGNQENSTGLITPNNTQFNFYFENLHEFHQEEKAVATQLDVVGNVFGFISLLAMMFAWVHIFLIGPFAGTGFRSVWRMPHNSDPDKYQGA